MSRLGQRVKNLYLAVFWYLKRFFYKLFGVKIMSDQVEIGGKAFDKIILKDVLVTIALKGNQLILKFFYNGEECELPATPENIGALIEAGASIAYETNDLKGQLDKYNRR
jgi:hypothetical protein